MQPDGVRATRHSESRERAANDYPEKLYSHSLSASRAGKDAEAHQLLCVGLQHVREPRLRSVMLFARCMTRARLCRWNEALQDADSLIRIRPSWSQSKEALGCALHGLGLDAAAFAAYESALELDPDNEAAILVLKERDRMRAEVRARALAQGNESLWPGFPALADPEAIPPLPPHLVGQEDMHAGTAGRGQDEVMNKTAQHGEGSGIRQQGRRDGVDAAQEQDSATPADQRCWEEKNFFLAAQDEKELRR